MSDLEKQLSGLAIDDLTMMQSRIKTLINQKKGNTKKDLLKQFKKMAKQVGLVIEEVVWADDKAPLGKKKKYVPKYQNPEDSNITWTGLGMKPRWVRAHLDTGGELEDLKIPGIE
ncbi:H-NS histone family protein [Candidatus Venteria ishoeyi]|uniref:H-NS histone family protein n=1 Tax=Candidatus Venteria ishoeyi TaxID=1899563 RepID=A0A1H6F301_9GAMM|nr:H-NS histone family protein [Candidatus Venteria ishoeyi]MDM8547575.1 H-NS histone family protein [Candidatus Venteria ishoeyi]SEH04537.1 H-NS histone family protein [Candidatus Venteria ishoeyi]